ncbi:MAG: O-acetyl-ADP-ribose deacetylase [Candidatus Heimdallarchaeota archaeon]|nr:MAG: O-acetyl-ADP-ribose deacetylase [Candidatus Heimdallarchaeota archaeon]
METKIGSTVIRLVQGDITKEVTDVIVNAANTSLRGGGGVDGAIHRAGGPEILQECIQKYPEGCKTGEARITTAGQMSAKYVIHTPGPIWRGGQQNEKRLLKHCYRNSLLLATEYNAKSIAFPSISTGVYGFPIERASKIALSTVIENLASTTITEVCFVLFSDSDYQIYEKNLQRIGKEE